MKKLVIIFVTLLFVVMFGYTAMAAYECTAVGMEKGSVRKAEATFRVNMQGEIQAGKIVIPPGVTKFDFPGGEYVYADGANLTKDQGQFEYIMEANAVEKTTGERVSVMVRKYKLQNIAEMQIKNRIGSTWFVFSHGWEFKPVE